MRIRHLCGIIFFGLLMATLNAASPAEKLLKQPDAWFQSDVGRLSLDCVLAYQTPYGDWPKNVDTTKPKVGGSNVAGTFDNSATTGELRLLARAAHQLGDDKYKQAFLRGFDHILSAQYSNGGWPQFSPPGKGYHRHVTFNDGCMVRILEFLHDAKSQPEFSFVDPDRLEAAGLAVQRGIDCILKCQIVVAGKHTVWCAQHDLSTLAPVQARSFEPPSLSGGESAGILLFLMSVENPSPEIIASVVAGVAWFKQSKIEGYRYQKVGGDQRLKEDPLAPPLWARFYDLQTNRPIFSDRDGVVQFDLSKIGNERRNGYRWYGNWGDQVLDRFETWPYRSKN